MISLSVREILKATGGKLIKGNENTKVECISTDSRDIKKDCLFVPIIGEKYDGHDFIFESLKDGACAAITQIDIDVAIENKTIIRVNNTLIALLDIAKYYRQKFNIPFIAVTGSVGKTTTKDMISSVLKQKYKVLKTQGNFNNEIGLPLTILDLNRLHQIGVIEMGMSGFGEIDRLSNVVKPDTAVITNIGVSHIEKLSSQENILKAKMEVINGMKREGNIVLNGDDKFLGNISIESVNNIYYYSIYSKKGIYPYNIKKYSTHINYMVMIDDIEYNVELPILGDHSIYNSLAAIQIGRIYNIPIEYIIKGLKDFTPAKMRQNIIHLNSGVTIIEDCYNASPQSVKAAISVMSDMEGKRKIAVLGDMLELGDYAKIGHQEVGQFAAQKGIDYLFLVGDYAKFIKDGAIKSKMTSNAIFCFEDKQKLSDHLKTFLQKDDIILIKGSRGTKMEQIVNSLCEVE